MKKVDVILKKAYMFEKLSRCESKQAMLKALGAEPVLPAPPEFNTQAKILEFQQNITDLVQKNPKFKADVSAALGQIPWGTVGTKKDIDGVWGNRSQKAYEMFKALYKTKPTQEAQTQNAKVQATIYTSLVGLRNKLKTMRERIAGETENFKNSLNYGYDDVKNNWVRYFYPEYNFLYDYADKKLLPEDAKNEWNSLVKYFDTLSKSYNAEGSPDPEPASLLNTEVAGIPLDNNVLNA